MQVTPPDREVVNLALDRAEEVVRAAGGCIDSLSFGREWREMFPESSREMFKGTNVTSFNKLLLVLDTVPQKEKVFCLRDALLTL